MTNSVPSRPLEWASLLLGVGLYCAAFSFGSRPDAALSAGLSGLLIAACSTVALNRYKPSTECFNLGVGSWVTIAPFVLGFGSQQWPLSIHLTIGICVSTIATMQLTVSRQAMVARAQAPKRK